MIRKIIGLVAVAACAAFLSGPAVAATVGKSRPDPMQIARGATAWAENCGRCHNLRDPKDFSDKNWDVIVDHMRTIAPLPGQIARDIKAFLKASN